MGELTSNLSIMANSKLILKYLGYESGRNIKCGVNLTTEHKVWCES
jgi:hypothetical protein